MPRPLDHLAHKLLSWLEKRRVAYYLGKMHVGERVSIKPGLVVAKPENVFIGNDVRINVNCLLQAHAPIHIGDMTMIAAGCSVVTANHEIAARGIEAFDAIDRKEVRIGRNCWLGAGVLVLPGVSIGNGVVVGAGSVVTGDLPAETVCVGIPARPVKARPRQD
jgi:maltose O-acetyltransferase